MASSIFGGIANAIDGGPKLNRISYSSALDDQLNALTQEQAAQRAADAADLARLSAAARGAAGGVEALAPGDLAILQRIIDNNMASGNDPFQTYTNVGNYNFGLLERIAGGLADQGRAGESQRLAGLGFGGRGGSTYQSNTLMDRISRNLAPVYAQTLGTIGRDASAIDAGRQAQNASTIGTIRERATIPGRALPYYSLPLEARGSVNAQQIAALLGLGEGFKTNTAGYREKATALGSIAGSLDSAVDTGLSLFSSGAMGGILGGGGGGGKSVSTAQPFQPVTFGPSGYGLNFSYSGQPLAPQVPPSGYNQYTLSNTWVPPWRN